MLPVVSVWCDSDVYTDPELLVGLARLSGDAAVGVLANRNVVGPAFDAVVDLARLTVKNLDDVGHRAVVAWRSPAEQVRLVRATLARSEPAAARLVEHLGPTAARTLLEQATTSRFRGVSTLRSELLRLLDCERFLLQADDPAFAGFVDAAARALGPDADEHIGLLTARASAAVTEGDLVALTDAIAALEGPDEALADTLLLAAHAHPAAITHWARHGGLVGALVAAADHRQDPQLLADITGRWSHRSDVLLVRLAANPNADGAALRQVLAEQVTDLLADPASDGFTLRMWTQTASRVLEHTTGAVEATRPAALDPAQVNAAVEAGYLRSPLYALELLDNPRLGANRWRALGALDAGGHLLTRPVARRVLDTLLAGPDGSPQLGMLHDRLVPVFPELARPPARPETPHSPSLRHLHQACRDADRARIEHPLAGFVVARLHHPAQYERLHQLAASFSDRRRDLGELLERCTAEHAAPGRGYAAALPDALGALD